MKIYYNLLYVYYCVNIIFHNNSKLLYFTIGIYIKENIYVKILKIKYS